MSDSKRIGVRVLHLPHLSNNVSVSPRNSPPHAACARLARDLCAPFRAPCVTARLQNWRSARPRSSHPSRSLLVFLLSRVQTVAPLIPHLLISFLGCEFTLPDHIMMSSLLRLALFVFRQVLEQLRTAPRAGAGIGGVTAAIALARFSSEKKDIESISMKQPRSSPQSVPA
ncbi:hypothetical protein DFH11DRAFT_1729154 [Phellopilus nigrolimitatus]|nr:hypothetical protein DFH11DRAFT_1729154 [Phellopilus nigrolimitatus]